MDYKTYSPQSDRAIVAWYHTSPSLPCRVSSLSFGISYESKVPLSIDDLHKAICWQTQNYTLGTRSPQAFAKIGTTMLLTSSFDMYLITTDRDLIDVILKL